MARKSKAQERVAIAKDVIKQVKALRFITKNGTYLSSNEFYQQLVTGDKDAQLRPPKACRVCAIGAVFVSALDKHDELKVGDFSVWWDREDLTRYLNRWFTDKQLNLIEAAFEMCADNESENKAEIFGERYAKSDERLIAIMHNIVKNEGTFVP